MYIIPIPHSCESLFILYPQMAGNWKFLLVIPLLQCPLAPEKKNPFWQSYCNRDYCLVVFRAQYQQLA